MAIKDISDKAKAIVVLILDILTVAFVGLTAIFGWDVPLWALITDMVAMILLNVFGIEYIFPPLRKKKE